MEARQENLLALMGFTGATEEIAAEKLATRVVVTVANSDHAMGFAREVKDLLGRSLSIIDSGRCDVELAIGTAFATNAPIRLHLTLNQHALTISPHFQVTSVGRDVPGLFRKIAACYAAGNVIARAVGGDRFRQLPDPFVVEFAKFGISAKDLQHRIVLDDAVLVGAGGVANGFTWAASELNLSGYLTIADPKSVSAGNLNRCLSFGEEDIGKPKATTLASRSELAGVKVDSFVGTFAELVAKRGRIRRVFTTPDSRDARRAIQGDLPLEIFDASTTDLSAIVIHSHCQPTGGACLSCIYPHVALEDQRLIHLAEGLGLTVDEVRLGFITRGVARKLVSLHHGLDEVELVGRAFDTVYKGQCGKGALLTGAGQQAVAPLAFISNLAGALLVVELVRAETRSADRDSTYATLDPWRPPHAHVWRIRGRNPDCEFCGKPNSIEAMKAVWFDVDWQSIDPPTPTAD
jgi:molybdopterin/thiamine biosynthesis adenylyltransferase